MSLVGPRLAPDGARGTTNVQAQKQKTGARGNTTKAMGQKGAETQRHPTAEEERETQKANLIL